MTAGAGTGLGCQREWDGGTAVRDRGKCQGRHGEDGYGKGFCCCAKEVAFGDMCIVVMVGVA